MVSPLIAPTCPKVSLGAITWFVRVMKSWNVLLELGSINGPSISPACNPLMACSLVHLALTSAAKINLYEDEENIIPDLMSLRGSVALLY